MDRLIDDCSIIYHLAAAVEVEMVISLPPRTLPTNASGSEILLATTSEI